MGWRSIFVSRPSRLSCRHSRLLISQDGEETDIPLEDIEVVLIETREATLTSHLVSELACRGTALLFCDGFHQPCGVTLLFNRHSRSLRVLQTQIGLSTPFRKNCWRRVVVQKLLNQAACLNLLNLPGGRELTSLSRQVRSGDPDNRESVGARRYFGSLMPRSKRTAETPLNTFLNYGYSIFRGAIARTLAVHGLHPALGIHHKSELNAFNLADDFLEPFRPLVDLWVMQNAKEEALLTPSCKHALVELLSALIEVEGRRETVLRAIDAVVGSFVAACRSKDAAGLSLPRLIGTGIKGCE